MGCCSPDSTLTRGSGKTRSAPTAPLSFSSEGAKSAAMDPKYFSAFAALAGSTIGGLTAFATSWLTQRTQFRAQRFEHDTSSREAVYRDFIEEASKLYADAYEDDQAKVANLVRRVVRIKRQFHRTGRYQPFRPLLHGPSNPAALCSTPRPLQENATSISALHPLQRRRAKPRASAAGEVLAQLALDEARQAVPAAATRIPR